MAGIAGYASFGEAADCVALNNYACGADPAATAARLAMSVSLLASFPLMFAGFRVSILALVRAAGIASEARLASTAFHLSIVCAGLGAVAAAAITTPDACDDRASRTHTTQRSHRPRLQTAPDSPGLLKPPRKLPLVSSPW